jgi:hypothetical protein
VSENKYHKIRRNGVTETTGRLMTDVDHKVSTNIVHITHFIHRNPTFVKTSVSLNKMAIIILMVVKVSF